MLAQKKKLKRSIGVSLNRNLSYLDSGRNGISTRVCSLESEFLYGLTPYKQGWLVMVLLVLGRLYRYLPDVMGFGR